MDNVIGMMRLAFWWLMNKWFASSNDLGAAATVIIGFILTVAWMYS